MLVNLIQKCLQAKNKIETLKEMPQRVENGIVYNFHNEAMFKSDQSDIVLLHNKQIGTRYTDALESLYLQQLDKISFFIEYAVEGDQASNSEGDELYIKVYESVGVGDKKSVRALCKELKEKWFALDTDIVDDAIDDIKECVSVKDVEEVKLIIKELEENSTLPKTNKAEEQNKEVDPVVTEILEDLQSAIDDKDKDEIEACLAELKDEDVAIYKEWEAKIDDLDNKAEEKKEVDLVVTEILEDLQSAIDDKDEEDIKLCLADLKDEVGIDSDTYKEWEAKVPKKRKRRGK